MTFRMVIELKENVLAGYYVELSSVDDLMPVVLGEKCIVRNHQEGSQSFEVRTGQFIKPIEGIDPLIQPDRLALSVASATTTFRPVYDFISSMAAYAISPLSFKLEQPVGARPTLERDGSNAVAVLRHVREKDKQFYELVVEYMAFLVPGLRRIFSAQQGTKEILNFSQELGEGNMTVFDASSMSDGTLRALGLLLAVYQVQKPSVLLIEEPELTVHPALAEMIYEILENASHSRQALVTTHSADILDHKDLRDHQIRVVYWQDGRTLIGAASVADRQAIQEHLYTAGELMSVGELDAHRNSGEETSWDHDIFSPLGHVEP